MSTLWIRFAAVVGAFLVGIWVGHDYTENELRAERNAELVELQRQNAHELQLKQNQIVEIEEAWLNQEAEIKTVYKDRVKTVTETVTEYVESHHLNHCRLDGVSLQHINAALSGAGKAHGVQLSSGELPGP